MRRAALEVPFARPTRCDATLTTFSFLPPTARATRVSSSVDDGNRAPHNTAGPRARWVFVREHLQDVVALGSQVSRSPSSSRSLSSAKPDPSATATTSLRGADSRVITNITDAPGTICNHIVVGSLGEISVLTVMRLLTALRPKGKGVPRPTIVLLQQRLPQRRLLQRIATIDDVWYIQVPCLLRLPAAIRWMG